jgi:hypothetical protein
MYGCLGPHRILLSRAVVIIAFCEVLLLGGLLRKPGKHYAVPVGFDPVHSHPQATPAEDLRFFRSSMT